MQSASSGVLGVIKRASFPSAAQKGALISMHAWIKACMKYPPWLLATGHARECLHASFFPALHLQRCAELQAFHCQALPDGA